MVCKQEGLGDKAGRAAQPAHLCRVEFVCLWTCLSHTHRCAYNKLTYGYVHKKTSHRCTDDSVPKQKHMYCVCMWLFSYIYLHIITQAALLCIRISDDCWTPQVGRRKKGKWGRMFLNTELKMCIWLDLLEQQRIYTHSQTHCLGRCILSLYQPLNS